MNQEEILAVLPHSEAEAKSLREIAQAMGLETSSYASWIKAERGLSGILRKLIKWGLVTCDCRQRAEGRKFWYNIYWMTEMAEQEGSVAAGIIAEQF